MKKAEFEGLENYKTLVSRFDQDPRLSAQDQDFFSGPQDQDHVLEDYSTGEICHHGVLCKKTI
jgi:hypothetical protein